MELTLPNEAHAIYDRIKMDLRWQIANKHLAPGDQLPTRRELMTKYNCSWATVQRAMNELCLEGLVRSERGRGTFVAEGVYLGNVTYLSGQMAPTRVVNPGSMQLPAMTGLPVNSVDGTTPNSVQILLTHRVQSVYYSLAQMMDGIKSAAHKMGRPVSYLDAPPELQCQMNLDGYVVVTPSLDDRIMLEAAWERGERFVVLGSDYDEAEFPCVNADTRGWTRRAVRRLVEAGHKQIGLLGLMPGFPNYLRTRQGYEDALTEAGITLDPSWTLMRDPQAEDLDRDIACWLAQHPTATGLFIADYTSVLAFTRVVKERGLSVPHDLSVAVMDELPSQGMLQVPLTAVSQPFSQLGQRAVERLVRMLDNEEVGGIELLPCKIITRDSIATITS